MEINGWAVIYTSYVWDDNLVNQLPDIIEDIRSRINPLSNEVIELTNLNGIHVL